MRVEAVEPLGGDLWRVRLSDGAAVELSTPALAASGLKPGASLDAEQVAGLHDEARADRAYRDAVRLLSFRARSRLELRRRLQRKGHDDAAVDRALVRLTRQGLLDDASFARQWARDQMARSPVGPRRLISGLIRSGVDPDLAREVAAQALAQAAPPVDGEDSETALAWQALQGRLARGFDPGDPGDRRRAFNFLLRRGFSAEAAGRALRRAGVDPHDHGPAGMFT